MDVKEYRKSYEAELAAHAATADAGVRSPGLAATAAAGDASQQRLTEIKRVPLDRAAFSEKIPALLATLGNADAPTEVRLAALNALGAATFLGEHFAPFRADYLNTLRQIVRPGTDPRLCEEALAVLAGEKDSDIQQLLRRGLQDPKSALVSPIKALQLLSFDDHAGIADIALNLFHSATDTALKEAALRVLATDPKSQGLFEQLLQDKKQPLSLRTLSATGLHFLNPQKFADVARSIVMDKSDSEDIRATTLGALANAPDHHVLHGDSDFLDTVRQLGADNTLKDLSLAARRMIAKP
jgi:hypothetical protein